MRSVLLLMTLFLLIGAVLVFGSKPVDSCTDWDEDGVCAPNDCNDSNPTVGYNDDADSDGVTVCQGDCDDSDASNIDKCAGNIFQMYPVFYNPPDQPCRQGYTIEYRYFDCSWEPVEVEGVGVVWVWSCSSQPYYTTHNSFMRDCSPW